jgi:hypothetical protein
MAGKTLHAADRGNTEERLAQLAGLLYEDMLITEVRRTKHRRTATRRSLRSRLAAPRRAERDAA